MKHGIVTILILTAAVISAGLWSAISAENSLVGTWLLTSFSLIVLDTKESSRPLFLTAGELKLSGITLTRSERTFIVGAYAGTYVVEGNKRPTMSSLVGDQNGLVASKFATSKSRGKT
jgi:hypothetical protein